jgi:hypothetical protein
MLTTANPDTESAMKRIARLALALVALATSSAALAGDGAAQWDLKGQKLGMPKEESLALAPNAACKEYAPGVDMCIDKSATFAGTPAHLVLKFLDGKLIAVYANQFDWSKAEEAGAGLTQKFGPAKGQTGRTVHVMDRRGNISSTYYLWQNGSEALVVEPFDDVRDGEHFAAVKLTDTAVHDKVWLPRAKGQKVADASDL